jgi:hypothetical protein
VRRKSFGEKEELQQVIIIDLLHGIGWREASIRVVGGI